MQRKKPHENEVGETGSRSDNEENLTNIEKSV